MSSFGEITAQYVKVPCEHCGNGIEFDASQLAGYETCVVPCPHCGLDTNLLSAKNAGQPPAITDKLFEPAPEPPHYVTVPCENCGAGIEFDANLLGGASQRVPCPHCSQETILLVSEEDKTGRFTDENRLGVAQETIVPPIIEEPVLCYIQPPEPPVIPPPLPSIPPPILPTVFQRPQTERRADIRRQDQMQSGCSQEWRLRLLGIESQEE
jgi:Zn finger protein HypA/HybF involved in hydrogenase expression